MGRKRKSRSALMRLVPRIVFLATWAFSLLFAVLFVFVLHKARQAYSAQGSGSLEGASLLHCPVQVAEDRPGEARAAIVIDDLGRDPEPVEKLVRLDFPVTLAVLPYRRHSLDAAQQAHRHGKEVLLHLPMQPRNYPLADPGPGSLLASMGREAIQQEIQDQIALLPYCVGVNPHMGTLFTELREPMRCVAAVLRERGLFFLDNRATAGSCAATVAREFGVPFVQRTHFLDEKRDEASVIRQLCHLADFAAGNGWAVGIGHPYHETLAALPKAVAAFREKNVKLVAVADLLPEGSGGPARSARLAASPAGEGWDKGAPPTGIEASEGLL